MAGGLPRVECPRRAALQGGPAQAPPAPTTLWPQAYAAALSPLLHPPSFPCPRRALQARPEMEALMEYLKQEQARGNVDAAVSGAHARAGPLSPSPKPRPAPGFNPTWLAGRVLLRHFA